MMNNRFQQFMTRVALGDKGWLIIARTLCLAFKALGTWMAFSVYFELISRQIAINTISFSLVRCIFEPSYCRIR
jgi:hypothetical protein